MIQLVMVVSSYVVLS